MTVAVAEFPGGRSFIGTDDPVISTDGEGLLRAVSLSAFRIETLAVTNERLGTFIAATAYRTEAERFGWSAVFAGLLAPEARATGASAQTPWWVRIEGACWAHPEGPGSELAGRWDHLVTHVSWADVRAFAEWAGGRLPTEAEREHAARAGSAPRRFPWGEQEPDDRTVLCNIWQGRLPAQNTCLDGFYGTAPAESCAPNPAGLFDMAGNVWESTADTFRVKSLAKAAATRNKTARDRRQKVLKGGSFLCHASHCYRYRIAARSDVDDDSSASNVGFRVAHDERRGS